MHENVKIKTLQKYVNVAQLFNCINKYILWSAMEDFGTEVITSFETGSLKQTGMLLHEFKVSKLCCSTIVK